MLITIARPFFFAFLKNPAGAPLKKASLTIQKNQRRLRNTGFFLLLLMIRMQIWFIKHFLSGHLTSVAQGGKNEFIFMYKSKKVSVCLLLHMAVYFTRGVKYDFQEVGGDIHSSAFL